MKDSNKHVTGWYLSLQPYDFTVQYRVGKANLVAVSSGYMKIEVLYSWERRGGNVTTVRRY